MALKKLEFQKFDLQKLKIKSGAGLVAQFYDLDNKNDLIVIDSDSESSPDLSEAIERLNAFLAESLGLLDGWEFAREHNRKNEEALKSAIIGYKSQIERCKVSGLVFVGDNETSGVKITGTLECESGSVGLASPKLVISESVVEVDDMTLEEVCHKIKSEIFLFLYKNKRGTHLFSELENKENSGLNNLKAV